MTDAAAPEIVQPAYRFLQVGDPVPWFKQNSTSNPQFSFDTVAGRYVVLCFYGMGSDEVGRVYGSLPRNALPGQSQIPVRRFWMVLNPSLRVRAIFPFEQDGSDREKV